VLPAYIVGGGRGCVNSTTTESGVMQCDHVYVFRRTFLYRMHLVVGIFLADMFEAGIPCSFRWWMSWLCHNTAIESDSVQLPARMSLLDPFCSVCWWRSPLGTCTTTKASVCLHKAAWWRPSEKQKPRIHPQAYKHNVFNAFHNPVEDVVVSQHCD
jgi:hypothetical protein